MGCRGTFSVDKIRERLSLRLITTPVGLCDYDMFFFDQRAQTSNPGCGGFFVAFTKTYFLHPLTWWTSTLA